MLTIRSLGSGRWGWLAAAAAAVICCAPMFFLGYHQGADLQVHVSSWMEASRQFQQHVFLPRWAAGANYGYGEPRFVFYPPLSWMAGGLLGLVVPWKLLPAVYSLATLLVAGTAMWICARELVPAEGAGMAAMLYAVNPFAISTIYNRSDYAELLAAAFLPLLFRDAMCSGELTRRATVRMALVLALIWLANFPAGVISSYALAVVLLVRAALTKSFSAMVSGAAALALTFGRAAFILIPAINESSWVSIARAMTPVSLPWNNFLFGRVADANMHRFNRSLSLLAVLLCAGAALAVALAGKWRRKKPVAWLSTALLVALSIFMMLPVSVLLWRLLPKLVFVQFPWRWLMVLCFAGALAASAALTRWNSAWAAWGLVALLLAALNAKVIRTSEWSFQPVTDMEDAIRNGAGYIGLPEYTPITAHSDTLDTSAPLATVSRVGGQSIPGTLRVERWSAEHKVILSDANEPTDVALKLLAYPAWRLTMNGRRVKAGVRPETGQIVVHLPAGSNRIEVLWGKTDDRITGEVVSLIAVLVSVAIWFPFPRTNRKPAASLPTKTGASVYH